MGENETRLIRQSEHPCIICGSMYRNGDLCNICGELSPVREEFYTEDIKNFNDGKESKGMGWDKKSHKVIIPKGGR